MKLTLFIIVSSALLVTACQQDMTQNASNGSPQPLHATVRDAGWYPPILNQEIDFGNVRSGAVIEAAGDSVLALGRQMNDGHQPVAGAIQSINFVVLGGAGQDASVGRKIVHFTIATDTLKMLAKKGATASQALDAAIDIGTWSPANDDVIDDYCKSQTPFCEAAR